MGPGFQTSLIIVPELPDGNRRRDSSLRSE
jgi:hypothetical protein